MSQKRQSNILKRAPKLELETPIRAQAVAVGVCDELSGWLGEALPRGWVRQLIAEAGTAYACNERFRRRVRGKNANGRDYLWIFMRHWLAAKVLERRPHLHTLLPAAYNTGHELPQKPLTRLIRVSARQPRGSAPGSELHVRLLSAMSF